MKNKKHYQKGAFAMSFAVLVGALILMGPRLPIAGNVVAAHRLHAYIEAVYPGSEVQTGWFAPYEPKSSSYAAAFTTAGGEDRTVRCNSGGHIGDDERRNAYLEENGLESVFDELNTEPGQLGVLGANWLWNEPDRLRLTLNVQLREDETQPFPKDEPALRGKLADGLMLYYDSLRETEPETALLVRQIGVSYTHTNTIVADRTEDDGDLYQIRFNLEDGSELKRSMVIEADLLKTEAN